MTPLRLALLEQDLLDPDDAHELRQRLAARRMRTTMRTATQIPTRRRSIWRIPPPAMGWPAQMRTPAILGSTSQVRIGDRFQIHINDLPDSEHRILVVLQRAGLSDWTVLSPIAAGRLTTLSQCHQTPEGARQIDLLARGPVGRQRWAVALLAAPLNVDFSLPAPQRWSSIQRLISRGEVPISTVDLDIIDPA